MKISRLELKKLGIDIELEKIEKYFFQLGHEVEEVEELTNNKLIIGQIEKVEKHPKSEKLKICQVKINSDEIVQIVCGAPNVKKQQKVIVALVGAKIKNKTIEKIDLLGVESSGMLLSLEELGFEKDVLGVEDYSGIHIVDEKQELYVNPMTALHIHDYLLDLFITSNRGDCQSYRGLYNDIRAVVNYNNKNNKLKEYNLDCLYEKVKIDNKIDNPFAVEYNDQLSSYFSHVYIKNINVQPSTFNDKLFLLKHGFKSLNNTVDISNELLLKTGIPSHIYDADKIEGSLKVTLAEKEELFIGLDEKEITIPKGTLVIKDEKKIVSLAGVMGSEETKVDNNTKNILIEVAHFKAEYILQSTKINGKKTEAAFRYSKNIDISILEEISNIFISKVLKRNTGAEISNLVIKKEEINEQKEINIQYENIRNILGIFISNEEIKEILEYLRFKITAISEFECKVIVPRERFDIAQENDIAEEIIRIYDIENIDDDAQINTFILKDKIVKNNIYENIINLEKLFLTQNLNQVVTYSLINEEQSKHFSKDPSVAIKLMSPMSNEHKYYRQSILPSLLNISKANFDRQERYSNIFEIGSIYYSKDLTANSWQEKLFFSALLAGEKEYDYLNPKKEYDYYDILECLTQIEKEYNIEFVLRENNSISELNPYASAEIYLNQNLVGFIGEVIYDYFKKSKFKYFVLELDMTYVFSYLTTKISDEYTLVGQFPRVSRDLTVILKSEEKYSQLEEMFKDIQYLKEYKLIDRYIDNEKETISYTVNFIFKKNSATLTQLEVDKEIDKIIKKGINRGFRINLGE